MDKPVCEYCGKIVNQPWGAINRALKLGKSFYCDRVHAGLARRSGKTLEQKKEEKRLYDLNYRATSPTLKQRKADYNQRTYDPVKAAVKRKERMPKHVEYCRRPEYKVKKKEYDRQYRAEKYYGEFWESFIALLQIEQAVIEQGDKMEIAVINGTLNKKQTRRREYERLNCNKS